VRGRLAGVCEEVDRLPAVGSPRHDRASTPRWGGRLIFIVEPKIKYDRLPAMATELVHRQPAAIYAGGSVRAAKAATFTIRCDRKR
jgi:hypothetical protein